MIFNKTRIANFLITLILFVWLVGIFWEVIVFVIPSAVSLLPFLKYNYSIVCHTQTEKLFSYGDFNTLLCSRCTGIYLGGFLSSLFILLGIKYSVNTKILLFSSIPIFIDIILYSIGIYYYSQIIAFFTGLLLGSVGFIYIHKEILELFIKFKEES